MRPLQRLSAARRRPRWVVAALAVFTAVFIYTVGETVFPYYTSNHDEAVYLQQAAMLLEGKLRLYPSVADVFQPWFFIVDGDSLYPKYTPVTAAVFAVGMLLGSARLALAIVAAGAVALTYAVVAEVFDRETGVVAALFLVLSPLFVVEASVFLPYVPAFCLNLLFAPISGPIGPVTCALPPWLAVRSASPFGRGPTLLSSLPRRLSYTHSGRCVASTAGRWSGRPPRHSWDSAASASHLPTTRS